MISCYRVWRKKDIPYADSLLKKDRLEDVCESKREFIEKFCALLPEFKEHCNRVTKQYEAVNTLTRNLAPEVECSVQVDFAENWAAKFQDEPTSVYFDKSQTTIHPMVVHYHTKESEELQVKSFVAVSD